MRMYIIVMVEGETLEEISVLPTILPSGEQKCAIFKTSTHALHVLEDIYNLEYGNMGGVQIWPLH